MLNSLAGFGVDRDNSDAAIRFFFDLSDSVLKFARAERKRERERQKQQSEPAHENLPTMKRRMAFFDRDENSAASRANFSAPTQSSFDRRAVAS